MAAGWRTGKFQRWRDCKTETRKQWSHLNALEGVFAVSDISRSGFWTDFRYSLMPWRRLPSFIKEMRAKKKKKKKKSTKSQTSSWRAGTRTLSDTDGFSSPYRKRMRLFWCWWMEESTCADRFKPSVSHPHTHRREGGRVSGAQGQEQTALMLKANNVQTDEEQRSGPWPVWNQRGASKTLLQPGRVSSVWLLLVNLRLWQTKPLHERIRSISWCNVLSKRAWTPN